MCGITGCFAREGHVVDTRAFHGALNALRHRGPDDEGIAIVRRDRTVRIAGGPDSDPSLGLPPIGSIADDAVAALGHRRLSILDLSPAGHQPMVSADETCWLTFNGEIYNFLELRDELAAAGVRFHSQSDTEVLLEAYRCWGLDMLPRLVGMFAFAIVDLRRGTVLIARDPFGIKPLYFSQTAQGLSFASEIKALLELPGVSRDVNPTELFRFLRFGLVDGFADTMFRDIQQLPAATYMTFALGRPQEAVQQQYWRVDALAPSDLSFDEAAGELRRRFEDSVRLHLRSDVPVGACLSGGVDSTAIVHYMRSALGDGAPLHTFSFLTDEDPRISERPYVDIAVRHSSTISHTVSPSPSELAADVDALIRAQDQPFGSTSIYAQYRVFQLAKEHGMKVMLDGQGSDEFFGGYQTAISAKLAGLMAGFQLGDASRLARAGTFALPGARARIALSSLGRLLPAAVAASVMPLVGEPLVPDWMSKEWFAQRSVPIAPRMQGRGRNALKDELRLFTEHLSLPQLLRFEDRNSMQFSIESRVPFCVPSVAGFAFSLPAEYLVSEDGTTKAILRRALRGVVPDAILDRPKVGFATPERDWLSALQPWIETQIAHLNPDTMPFLTADGIRRLVARQLATRGHFQSSLWRVLNVLRWSEILDVRCG